MLTFLSASSNNFSTIFAAPNWNFTATTSMIALAQHLAADTEELDYFITPVNSFHPALKYTWVVSEYSIAVLAINVSISGNRLSTSAHYKPTDSRSYLLHSSSTRQELQELLLAIP